MAFDFTKYRTYGIELRGVDPLNGRPKSDSRVICFINPETITETLPMNIDKVKTINSNNPTSVVSGTNGRTVSFTLLIHGFNQRTPGTSEGTGRRGNLNTFVTSAANLIPFSANVVRGIRTALDIANILGSSNDGPQYPLHNRPTTYSGVENQIEALFKMVAPSSGKTAHEKVTIIGYPSYDGMLFYLENIQVVRKFWDNELRTMFAEVTVTLFQTGNISNRKKFTDDADDLRQTFDAELFK